MLFVWNVASVSIFYSYYFVDVHLNWHNWFHFLILEEGRLVILINCMIFQSPFLCYKDLYVKFPRKVKLWNYLPIECFLLTYDLNGLSLELTDTFYL